MTKYLLVTLCFYFACANQIKFPVYSYSLEVSDEMEAHASNYPLQRYRSYSNNYYPNHNFQAYPQHFQYGYGGLGYPNPYPYFGNRLLGEITDDRFIPHFYNRNLFNRGYFNKHLYDQDSERSKNFQHAGKNEGEQFYEGVEGFKDDNVNVKNIKNDVGHYNEEVGKSVAAGDENSFHNNINFKERGNQGAHQNQKSLRNKGHVVKGFKKHHRKDEDAKTEEFYDESHDEGGNTNFGEHSNSFGKNAADFSQGGHNNKNYAAIDKNVGSLSNSGHSLNSNDGDRNEYLGNKQKARISAFDLKDDTSHALLENQEINKVYKHHPYIIPFINK